MTFDPAALRLPSPPRSVRLSRRGVLVGGLGALARAVSTSRASAASEAAPGRALVVLWMNGGPSHLDTWDKKTGAKAQGPHKPLATRTRGLVVSEHLARTAELAPKLAVIRSLATKEGNHQRAQHLLRTSYAPSPTVDHPPLSAWISKRAAAPPGGLPSVVALGGPGHGGGFFGVAHAPFALRRPGTAPEDTALPPGVDAARFARRLALLDAAEERFAAEHGGPKVEGRRAVQAGAIRLMRSPDLAAFDLDGEPAALRARFGDSDFGRGCHVALRLVERGVRYVEVVLDGWDTHVDVFGRTQRLLGVLDPAMATLLAELDARGLWARTTVAWMGDFGRTPRINGNGGRDHHPQASSVVLAGGAVRGGVVHGATDDDGARVVAAPVSAADVVATLAASVGLDPADTAVSPAGRPIALSDHGTPIAAVLRA